MDAGLEVFLDRGVAAATLDQITERAGVAKGTFYLHFDSKERLLAALQVDFETALVDRIDGASRAPPRTGRRGRPGWTAGCPRRWPTSPPTRRCTTCCSTIRCSRTTPRGRAGPPPARDLVDSLAGLIGDGIAAGEFRTSDATLTAMLLCSALHRAFDRIWHRDEALDLDRLTRAVRELFHRALGLDDL
ncbi:hypothetical protein BJF78_04045 [Pseudonocardia sp. CNS-139]|nr:hypothetical protein BJF78_04045 [Pseudonocardia sp. CNS-139]